MGIESWPSSRSEGVDDAIAEKNARVLADNIISQPRSALEEMARLEGESWKERQLGLTEEYFPEFSDSAAAEIKGWPEAKLKEMKVNHNSFPGALRFLEMTRRTNEKIVVTSRTKTSEAKKPYYVIFGEEDRKWGVSRAGKIMFLREGSTEQQRRQAKDIGFRVY